MQQTNKKGHMHYAAQQSLQHKYYYNISNIKNLLKSSADVQINIAAEQQFSIGGTRTPWVFFLVFT